MKIGFFGDSFCLANHVNESHGYHTYIHKLEQNYNAEIVNLGVGGSSIYDVVLIQLDPFIRSGNWPDVCIFVWTSSSRLFNRDDRGITSGTVMNLQDHNPVHSAAKMYYKYLYDVGYNDLTYTATIQYIDTVILAKIPKSTKIINLWSFGEPTNRNWDNVEFFHKDNLNYIHRFTTGMEIRPALMSVSVQGMTGTSTHNHAPNHLDGNEKNEQIYNWIKNAIDNYTPGRLINATGKL